VGLKGIVLAVFLGAGVGAQAQASGGHSFGVQGGQFELDGKPFRVISGEMHYPRVPRAYWRQRFQMAKAMGLNTITTYVFWNEHEVRPGVYDFSGNKDVAEFVREAQQEGLYVILRPGPYVCAEWEFGGYPAWLLKDHATRVRTSDPKFMQPVGRWIARLGKELAPLQIGNGGPIILTQVENEYGSFGNDHGYMKQTEDLLVQAGFTKSQLYTADGPKQVPDGSLPNLPVGINFGGDKVGVAEKAFTTLKQFRPDGPFINSEYWAGWFDHWGGKHAHTDTAAEVQNLEWMLQQGYSVSFYMFHGGTSFGWMNGANSDGRGSYEPDVTSYDYDSALDESGRPAPKYFLFRDAIAKATGVMPPPVPSVDAPVKVPEVVLRESASLWKNLPKPIHSETVLSMEDVDQAYGYILYRTSVPAGAAAELVLDELHSYAMVYADGKLAGKLDRRMQQNHLTLPGRTKAVRLDLLVENTGRVNFGKEIGGERAGITKQVTLAGSVLKGWEIFPLPMTAPSKFVYSSGPCEGPCFQRATMQVAALGDTFLEPKGVTKGMLWLNGTPLGRVWDVGPQKTLYAPAPMLVKGANEIVVFDLESKPDATVVGQDAPALGPLQSPRSSILLQ
jgi:beta-galactosidase